MVSLQLENQQLQSDASLCEGRTASEWHEYSVDLQKGYAQLAKELLEKNIESDELRLLNQGLEKAHRTAVEALEALQLSHAAVLVDRDRLVSAGGSETHESHNELATINSNTIDVVFSYDSAFRAYDSADEALSTVVYVRCTSGA